MQTASEDDDDFDYEERWSRGGPQGANQVSQHYSTFIWSKHMSWIFFNYRLVRSVADPSVCVLSKQSME